MWAILWIYLWMIWTSVIIDVMWFPLLADLTISDYYFSTGRGLARPLLLQQVN